MGSATLNTRVELSAMGPGERRMGSGVAARVAKWPAYTASGPRPFAHPVRLVLFASVLLLDVSYLALVAA